MPYYEYECPVHGRFTKFYTSFREAEPFIDEANCEGPACGENAKRVMSKPLEAMLYGSPEGYHKPSATKRYNTKVVSAKEGNKNAVG